MQIDESRKLLLSDTLIPDIFITEYLPALDGLAVKLYVYLLLTARNNRQTSEPELARRMGVDPEQIKTATVALASAGLVTIKEKGLEIVDIKALEIEKTYRQRTTSTPLEALDNQSRSSIREKLMADIAKTFFQGLMSPSWYAEIDNWFELYHFEPEVIYALFQECARRNKLDSKAYIAKVAENWAARGIITFKDLNEYFLAYNKVSKACQKIGRKLRKNMTEYDEEIVTRWIEKLGYDFEIIELALRKTVKLTNPNLEFIDRILQEWFSHQLHDSEQVKVYEAEKAARLAVERSRRGASEVPAEAGAADNRRSGRKPANIGNFSQRQYSDEFLSDFYEPIPAHEPTILEAVRPEPPTTEAEPDRSEAESDRDDGNKTVSDKVMEGQIDIAEMIQGQGYGR